jgi:nitrogen fixation protein FixH
MLLGLGGMTYLAVDDPGFSLEPNYYDKAVHWDRAQAEARASEALGYRVELAEPLRLRADRSIELELSLVDRQGAPLGGARVEVDAFPNATASRVQRTSLREVAPGRYRATLAQGALGLWELRVSAERDGQRYRQVLRRDVARGGAA